MTGLDPKSGADWTADQFREAGLSAIEWVARYLESVGERPVVPNVKPGDVGSRMPDTPPDLPESFESLLADLDEFVVPGLTHWNHPGFFAYFGITGSGPGILGELVASAFNTNGMLWKTSPATSEVEFKVMDWLLQMFDLPRDWFGFLVDTASVATLVSLAAAREALDDLSIREEGLAAPGYPRLRLYASTQTHSSIEKAAITLGIGTAGVRKIDVDDQFRLDVDALESAIAEDRAAGWRPFAVVATVGTTSSTSVDPVEKIADVCVREGLWLHVDAAYAGSAAILPEKRPLFAGCERADSYIMNPHKWLFVPIDASALFTSRSDVLERAFQLVPDYLRTDSEDGAVDLMNYGIQMGRRFRAIKLWWVIRSFGVEGIRERISRHCRWAEELGARVDADERFELVAPVLFSTVCFRARWNGFDEDRSDAANEELAAMATASGKVFLAHTRLRGRITLRIAIGNLRTRKEDLECAWQLLNDGHTSISERKAT